LLGERGFTRANRTGCGISILVTDSSCFVVSEAPVWPLRPDCRIVYPHQEGVNVLWCDGHVKWCRKGSEQLTRHRYWTCEQD